jgi:hypothetical protein
MKHHDILQTSVDIYRIYNLATLLRIFVTPISTLATLSLSLKRQVEAGRRIARRRKKPL